MTSAKLNLNVARVIRTETVEVEFPLYSQIDLEKSITYMRLDADMTKYTIRFDDEENRCELEIERNYKAENRDADYVLGRGEYKSSAEAFSRALDRLTAAVLGIPRPSEE